MTSELEQHPTTASPVSSHPVRVHRRYFFVAVFVACVLTLAILGMTRAAPQSGSSSARILSVIFPSDKIGLRATTNRAEYLAVNVLSTVTWSCAVAVLATLTVPYLNRVPRLRFGLRELFTTTLICCLLAAWSGDHIRLQRQLARDRPYKTAERLAEGLRQNGAVGKSLTDFPEVLALADHVSNPTASTWADMESHNPVPSATGGKPCKGYHISFAIAHEEGDIPGLTVVTVDQEIVAIVWDDCLPD